MRRFAAGLVLLSLTACNAGDSNAETCLGSIAVKHSSSYQVTVADNNAVRQLQPTFFGFNLEWLEFQLSLWDRQSGTVKPEVLELLRSFPGAVYRYPGGTASNHFDWHDAEGPIQLRPVKRQAAWMGPLAVQFGPVEYLKFVREVGGEAWYVANLYGTLDDELPEMTVARSAGELATFMRQQKEAGLPPVLRWELGNELDRDRYHWLPQKLGKLARAVIKEVRSQDPSARFIALLEEYPAMKQAGFSASGYNQALVRELKSMVDEYALHLYYDGKESELPVNQKLAALCRAVDDAHSAGIKNPAVWITEHARVPEGAWKTPNWKYLWPETANLQAAISVADMLIATAQMPEVRGTMIHALHATDGPWPLLHRARNNGSAHPSVVLLALRVLRESMLSEVLLTSTASDNTVGYEGGYDVRAVVMTDRQKYSLWLVNRAGDSADTSISIPALKGAVLAGKHVWLSDENIRANNYLNGRRVEIVSKPLDLIFDQRGKTHVVLPPNSVSAITFSGQR